MSLVCALEIGNTSVSCALFRGEELLLRAALPSDRRYSKRQYRAALTREFGRARIEARAVEHVFVSSVVPGLTARIAAAARWLTGRAPLIIDTGSRLNVTVRPQNRGELGSDIMLNLAEAWERAGARKGGEERGAVIVVDFGTALTVSAVDHRGVICGVAIAPGIATAMHSLTAATAQLPAVAAEFPARVMGTDTSGALQSGVMHGYCGLVGELVRGFQRELRELLPRGHEGAAASGGGGASVWRAPVIATGGGGAEIHKRIAEIDEYNDELTVRGLLRVGRGNLGAE